MTGAKACAQCGETKPLDAYYERASRCKECLKANGRAARAAERVARPPKPPKSLPVAKRCGRCGETKPLSEFAINPSKHDGRGSCCRPCHRAYAREWAARGGKKPPTEEQVRKKRERDRERYRADRGVREKARAGNRRRKYGVTQAQVDAMYDAQGGLCGICRSPQLPSERPFAVDHDHETGRVRGLLCGRCNSGLGLFREDGFLLQRAIAYVTLGPTGYRSFRYELTRADGTPSGIHAPFTLRRPDPVNGGGVRMLVIDGVRYRPEDVPQAEAS